MPKIDELWAYIAEEEGPGEEGLCAFLSPDGWVPMTGADKERMDSLRELARGMAKAHGKPITLVRFSVREEIEAFKP